MRLYLILVIVLLISVHPSVCREVAYAFGPDGEKPIGLANITDYKGTDVVSFTVSAATRGPSTSYKAQRTVDSIKEEINKKIDRGNRVVRNEGLNLVGSKSGSRRIDQICSIYEFMVGNWTFVDDWRGLDEYQYSNYTLKMGNEVGSSGKGDCDDFSILLASLIESIGGTPRIILAYSPTGGHAYTEVYLGKKNNKDMDRMLKWLRSEYNVEDIDIHADLESNDVWLNMDWWKDTGGAKHPGGPFYQAATHIPIYIQEDMPKTPLTPIENLLPVALFSCSSTQLEVDDLVIFDAAQSNDWDGRIMDYEWNFGDGETAHGITKSACRHLYSSSGTFHVNLTVTDNDGDRSTKTSEIIVKESLPKAISTFYPASPKVSEVVTFDASHSTDKKGRIIGYDWDFGDGYFGKRASIKHQYLDSGNYSVKLTVTNDKGMQDTIAISVVVNSSEGLVNESIRKGDALDAQGKYDEAIKAYDEAIELDPNYANAWNGKGTALFGKKKYDEAVQAYDKAIELDPNHAIAWNNKGWALYNQGKYDEAIKAYDKAIKLDPNYAYAWNGKGNALNGQKKYDEAIKAYDEAISLDPNYAYAWNNKGIALDNQGKYDEAIKAYDEAIRLDPNYANAWNGKDNALNDQGRYDEAIKAYDEAIELDPNYANAWNGKGTALFGKKKYDEAVQAYDKAIELDPNHAYAWNGKGSALKDQGKYEDAIRAYDEAIRLDPTFANTWYNKGNALSLQGKYDEAIKAYDEVIRLNPKNAEVWIAKTWNEKGNALRAMDYTAEADVAFAKARELGYNG